MTPDALLRQDATAMADAVRAGTVSAVALVQASLDRIAATDARVNAFTDVVRNRALRRAAQVDASLALGNAARTRELPLLGVPFAVKNLFDVAGLTTLAGSKIERESRAGARRRDAGAPARELPARCWSARSTWTSTPTASPPRTAMSARRRNPHDLDAHRRRLLRRLGRGGGGRAGAADAGLRHQRLDPRAGLAVRRVRAQADLRPAAAHRAAIRSSRASTTWARSRVRRADLALAYDAMQGPERPGRRDPGCAQRAAEPVSPLLGRGVPRAAHRRAGRLLPPACASPRRWPRSTRVAQALGASRTVELPMVEAGRAAAFLITNAEGAALHLADLRTRPQDFEPLSRDRFLAGALLPAAWVARAQRVRRAYAEQVARVFERFDVLLAAATPCAATADRRRMVRAQRPAAAGAARTWAC